MAKKGQAQRREQKKARQQVSEADVPKAQVSDGSSASVQAQADENVQYFNALFQDLPAEEKDLIRILAPHCYENNVDITNVNITKPSNEKAIAMATSLLFQDRELFNRGILEISDTRGHDWDLLMKLFSAMKWWQQEASNSVLIARHGSLKKDSATGYVLS